MVLQEMQGVVEKEKKSRIFTRDRTLSSNKYKKSPMPKMNENDNGHYGITVSGGNSDPTENLDSIIEVCQFCY